MGSEMCIRDRSGYGPQIHGKGQVAPWVPTRDQPAPPVSAIETMAITKGESFLVNKAIMECADYAIQHASAQPNWLGQTPAGQQAAQRFQSAIFEAVLGDPNPDFKTYFVLREGQLGTIQPVHPSHHQYVRELLQGAHDALEQSTASDPRITGAAAAAAPATKGAGKPRPTARRRPSRERPTQRWQPATMGWPTAAEDVWLQGRWGQEGDMRYTEEEGAEET